MKVLLITILMICLMSCQAQGQLFGQSNAFAEGTKAFFQSWVEKKKDPQMYRDQLAYIKVDKVNMDHLPLEKYGLSRVYNNFDFNRDGSNDLGILITRDEEDGFKSKDAQTYDYLVFLYLEYQNDSSLLFKNYFVDLLNQGTEGLLYEDGFIDKGEKLLFRQYGTQIDTDWCTEFVFEMEDNEWYLKEANTYKAHDNVGTYELQEKVKSDKIIERIPIDLVDYYKYFPFGFSDGIY